MSFSFYLDLPEAPPIGELLEPIPYDILCVEEDEIEPEDEWPEGYTHLYREGLSTCAVEINREDGRFQIRIMAFCSPEDYELALAIVEQLALYGEVAAITPEDGEPLPLGQLKKQYGKEWIADQVKSLFGMLPAMVARDHDTALQVPAAVRPFWIGPRLMKELTEGGPAETLPQRIIEAIRKVQYLDPEEYFCATVMEVCSKKEGAAEEDKPDDVGDQADDEKTNDDSFTVTAWGPGVRYLFPNVDYLAVIEDMEGEGHFLIPYDAVHELAGDRCSWLDEKQTLVEPFDEDEWPELLARARKHEIDPSQAGKDKENKPE
jgi:hypothetical protein